jgi:hypothetical protein
MAFHILESRIASPSSFARALRLTSFLLRGDDYAPGAGAALLFPLRGRFSLEAEAMADRDATTRRRGRSRRIESRKADGVQPNVRRNTAVK